MLEQNRSSLYFRLLAAAVAASIILACTGSVTPDLEDETAPADDPPPVDTPSVEVRADAGGPYAALSESPVITFDGTKTTDPESVIMTYHWDFADGALVEGVVVEHEYAATVAEYSVKLTVKDADEIELDSDITTARIRERPVASFEVATAAEDIVVGRQIEFDASASEDGDGLGAVAEYRWDFDYETDNFSPSKSTSDPVTTHVWTFGDFPREVTVAVMVVDDDGFESDIATSSVEINDAEGATIIIE